GRNLMKRTKAKIDAMKRPADLVAAQEKMRSKHEGRTTTTAPQPFLPPTDSAVEQHFSPAGRNCELSFRTKGVTFAHTSKAMNGVPGVHWYSPGLVSCGQLRLRNGPTAPSAALRSRIAAAAACPTAIPCALVGSSGMAA